MQQQTDGLGQTLTEQAADAIQELVLSNDLLSLNVVLNQLTDDAKILSIAVYDIDQRLISSAGERARNSSPNNSNELISVIYTAQIALQDSIAGTVQLQLDTSTLQSNIEKTQLVFWIILGLGLLLTIAAAFALTSHLTSPLIDMAEAMQNPLDSSLSIDSARTDEIALLQQSCADLLEQYQYNYDELQQFISMNPANIDMQFSGKASKPMASILVVKVVDINTAIELLHPSTLSELLSEYLFYLTQASQLYGASIHRITGESVMLVFDSGSDNNEHSFNAVRCAQLFLLLMQRVKQIHKENASQALAFTLSIHSGDIFIAANNMTQDENIAFIIGKAIETSYFLCKQAQTNELIISETTYYQAGGQKTLAVKDRREITMPTDKLSFMAYILDSQLADYTELLEQQSKKILP